MIEERQGTPGQAGVAARLRACANALAVSKSRCGFLLLLLHESTCCRCCCCCSPMAAAQCVMVYQHDPTHTTHP
jgi:hypothetical protein